ncbi:hypothetical protein [Enterobacter soli]|uniref:hypothetical protein n=1 Tax=Enterobacter soli TaxID=885040 RepID=UPI0034CD9674
MKIIKYAFLLLLILGATGCDDDEVVLVEANVPMYIKRAGRLIETYLRASNLNADCKAISIRTEWLIACKPHKKVRPLLIYSVREGDFVVDDYHIEAINRAARDYARVGMFRQLKVEIKNRPDIDEEQVNHEYEIFADRYL